MIDVKGRRALVTGAARGIGYGVAKTQAGAVRISEVRVHQIHRRVPSPV